MLLRFQHAPRESFSEYSAWLPDALLQHVEAGAHQMAGAQRLGQRRLADDGAARRVHQDAAGLHRGDRVFGNLADAVVNEFHRPLDDTRDFRRNRLQRVLRVPSLRPAEMRKQDDFRALVGKFGEGRGDALDPG